MNLAITLFTVLAFAILIAMAVGQYRVAYRAINHGKAGFRRFTYIRAEAPIKFWAMVVLEWIGFAVIFAYLLALIAAVLLP